MARLQLCLSTSTWRTLCCVPNGFFVVPSPKKDLLSSLFLVCNGAACTVCYLQVLIGLSTRKAKIPQKELDTCGFSLKDRKI